MAGAQETRTIGNGLRGHSDDQIRPLKPDNRPEMTKENARWETKEEDALTENKGDCVGYKHIVVIYLLIT